MAGRQGPGKTAPRLLQDLLSYDPRFEDRARRNLLTSPPPPWDPNAVPTPAVPRKNCRHVFLTKESQSQLPGDEPSLGTVYKLAAYCSRCRHHFLLQVDYTGVGERKSICRGSNPEFPLHHFIFQGDGGKGTSTFTCSAPRCPVHLTIQVTPPRLSEDDVLTLTDGAALRRRWEAAKSQASERADSTMARPVDAPDFLNTYLQDSLNPVKGKTRIPLLNRKFFKTFGTDCDGILKKVGFTSAVEQEDDGSPCHVWYLPKPDTLEDPHIIEDVRYELNSIILSFPEQERLGTRHVPLKPPSARTLMGKILGCDEYPQAKGRVQTRNTNHEEDHPYYAGLGAVGDFADELLLFSFQRQAAVDEPNAPYYFECLQDLALGRNSEGLQSQVGMLASQGYFKRSEVALAYRYFDMDPAHESFLNDDHIIGVFKSRLGDISPAAAEEARRQLRIIGHTRNSDNIMAAASDTLETYEQALSWLDMEHSHADDFVTAMFATKVNDNPANTPVARQAVDIIAKHRNSQRLRDFLEYGSMGAAAMDEGEAYAILQIADRSSQLDLDILQTQVQLQIDGDNAARIQEAYAKVKQDQESRFGKPSGFQMSPSVDYPVETWPVGCCNIGNTCYLNSVLQFLFTIKPLRELVLDCDGKLQELTPEALKQKRVGREAVSLARVETGQQFVRELRKLFESMINAPTHNIRPDRSLAALALTRTESAESADSALVEYSTANSGLGDIGGLPVSGPMLPPTRPDSVMGDGDGNGNLEKVKDDDAGSDTSTTPMDLTADDDVKGATATIPKAPSRPPPIPPRPKASADQGFKKVEEVARQQDAAEILNNVYDLLSCAFQGHSTLEDGEQGDLIKDLFFSGVTTVREKDGKKAIKTDLQDNILVSTQDRDRKLCAALDDEFGLTELDSDGMTKFELFDKAAPILEFNVRRLQYENDRVRKDESHLELDKVLYLDRYLKKTSSRSEAQLQELRNQQWSLQKELRQLEERRKTLKETEFGNVDLLGVLDEAAVFTATAGKELSPPASDAAEPESEGLDDALNQRAADLRPEVEKIESRMQELEREIDTVFEDCKDHAYYLHAIFIHAGGANSGHYWIYIYDFQNEYWRSYNDETVKLEDEETIFRKVERAHPPTSTGIVYVRADVRKEYTEAVCRNPENVNVEMKDAEPANAETEFENIPVLDGVPTETGGSVVNEDSAIEELRPSAPGSAKRRAEFREMGGSFPAKKPMRKPVSKFTLKLRGLREE